MEQFINDAKVKILGDPHLGKKFVNGVPLERRGEREQKMWTDFRRSINEVDGVDFHICMGDIFDKFSVPSETLFDAALAYRDAAATNPGTQYVILRGNHDASRDRQKISCFEILNLLLAPTENVLVVTEPEYIKVDDREETLLGFVPWEPFISASEAVDDIPVQGPFDAIFGHWDMDDYGDDNPNLIPVEKLKGLTNLVYTGHVHTPETRQYGDLTVHVTGSMQPYTHGEDPDGDWYVTLTPQEAETTDIDLTNKCVRIVAKPDDDIPDINCLQLKVQRLSVEEAEEQGEDLSIESEGIDFEAILKNVFAEQELDDETQSTVREIMEDLHHSE